MRYILFHPPTVNPEWNAWAQETFNFPDRSEPFGPACVRMTYYGLIGAMCGSPIVLSQAFVEGLGLMMNEASLPFFQCVADAIKRAIPEAEIVDYKIKKHARQIVIPSDKARAALDTWESFRETKVGKSILPDTLETYSRKGHRKTNRLRSTESMKAEVHSVVLGERKIPTMQTIVDALDRPWKDPELIDRLVMQRRHLDCVAMMNADELLERRVLRLYRLEDVFAHGESIQLVWTYGEDSAGYRLFSRASNIKREDRAVLFPESEGYVDVDLKSAHLAIAAKLTGSEALAKAAAGDVWATLGEYLAGQGLSASKDQLKRFLYTCTYGGTRQRQICSLVNDESYEEANRIYGKDSKHRPRNETAALVERELAHRAYWQEARTLHSLLGKHPSIRELLVQIRLYLGRLKKTPQPDAFGIMHGGGDCYAPTAMASICSSWEKWLLLPIYEDPSLGHNFQVILDMHDGLLLKWLGDRTYEDGRRLSEILYQRLSSAVDARARSVCIPTTLVRK